MSNLKIGDKAPEFILPDTNGNLISISELQGNPIVLYFYPKDDTSGCTTEALDFTALIHQFKDINVRVFGISPDSVKKHCNFQKKHKLDVELLADEEKKVLNAYGVWCEKSMYGRKYMGVERTTFLLNSNGIIAEIWNKVKVKGHAEAVLKAAQDLVL